MQFYKKIKQFEWFIQIEERQILPHFFDRRFEDRTYEIWLGRCYFVLTVAET